MSGPFGNCPYCGEYDDLELHTCTEGSMQSNLEKVLKEKMNIDMSSPFKFLRTMRLSHYEIPSDFMLDMHDQLDKLEQEIKTLKEQLAKIEGILKFYADNESWDDDNIAFEDTEKRITEYDGKLLIFYEGGKLARQYFAEKEKQDKENKDEK